MYWDRVPPEIFDAINKYLDHTTQKVKGQCLNPICLPIKSLRSKVSGEGWSLPKNQGLVCAQFVVPMIDGPRGAQTPNKHPG
jgi:hypothetical protein